MNIRQKIIDWSIDQVVKYRWLRCNKCYLPLRRVENTYDFYCPNCIKRLEELENRNDEEWKDGEPKYGTLCVCYLENNYGVKHMELVRYDKNFNHDYWKILKWKEIIL